MYANDKVDSDVRLNAQLLDVWEANANQDIYILIRLSNRGPISQEFEVDNMHQGSPTG